MFDNLSPPKKMVELADCVRKGERAEIWGKAE
jgi:hypothetical protein